MNEISTIELSNLLSSLETLNKFEGVQPPTKEFIDELTRYAYKCYKLGLQINKNPQSLEDIVLEKPSLSMCGCLGPTIWTKCGCSMVNSLYTYRYHVLMNIRNTLQQELIKQGIKDEQSL